MGFAALNPSYGLGAVAELASQAPQDEVGVCCSRVRSNRHCERSEAIHRTTIKKEWIASSRSLSSGRPKGRTRWLLAMAGGRLWLWLEFALGAKVANQTIDRHSGMVRRTRPQMCNCTSGNLEVPGSMLRIAPERPQIHKSTTTLSLSTDTASVSATYGPFTTLAPGST